MPYVGRDLQRGNYLKLDDIASSFDGSTTTFNLQSGGSAFYPGSAFSIFVSVGGVIQEPESAYTINKNTITFANAPHNVDDCFITALGVALGVGVPGHGTVNGSQLAKPFNYDGGLLYLDSTNDKVGVGITTPTHTLDVNGTANFSGNVTIGGTLTYQDVANIDAVGIATFQDDVNFNGTGAGISSAFWDKSANEFKFKDGVKLSFGDSQDLTIQHTGAESRIIDTGTGDLKIGGSTNVAIVNGANNQIKALFGDTAVSLNHSGNTKFTTKSTGAEINYKLSLGGAAGSPGILELYEGGAVSEIRVTRNSDANSDLQFKTESGDGTQIRAKINYSKDFELVGNSLILPDSIIHSGDTDTKIRFPAADTFAVETGGSERLRINSSGYIGLGTGGNTSPTAPLSVKVGSDGEYVLDMMGTSTKQFGLYYDQGSWDSGIFGIHEFDNSGNVSERFTINAGKIGIGTNNPDSLLHVMGTEISGYGAHANTKLCVEHDGNTAVEIVSGTNYSGGIYFSDSGADGVGKIEYYHGTGGNDMRFTTDGDQQLCIHQDGHILTQSLTSPSFNNDSSGARILEVTGEGSVGQYGSINISGNHNTDDASIGALRFINRENSNSSSGANANSKSLADIKTLVATSDSNAGDDCGGHLVFSTKTEASTNNSERVRIDSVGRVLIGSTASVGDATLQVYTADKLHPGIKVNSPGANGYTMIADTYTATESQLNLGVSQSGSGVILSRCVKVSTSSDDAYLSSQAQYSTRPSVFKLDDDGSFVFLNTSTSATTAVDSAVALTERLRIHNNGQVEFKNGSFSNNVNCVMASGSTLEIGATATIKLRTATNERLQIDSTGNVHVGFSGNSLYFQNGFNNSNARIQNAGATNNSNLRFLTRNAGTEAERFRIAYDGSIYVGGSGASATAGKLWFNDTSAYSSYIKQIAGSSALSFHTGQSQPERLRIASNGNISIGGAAAVPSSTGYNKATLHILQTNSGTSVGCQLKFSIANHGHGDNNGGFISYWGDRNFYYNNRENSGLHRFYVKDGSGNSSEKLQIGSTAVYVTGHFEATTKSFIIDHPTKENHKLRYACLEGPENSVYVRGRSSDSVIELPDYWVGLVHDDSITVNVTPIGNKNVWVESINNNSVTIGSDDSTEYFYTVFAERKDVEKLEVEVEN